MQASQDVYNRCKRKITSILVYCKIPKIDALLASAQNTMTAFAFEIENASSYIPLLGSLTKLRSLRILTAKQDTQGRLIATP